MKAQKIIKLINEIIANANIGLIESRAETMRQFIVKIRQANKRNGQRTLR